MFATFDSDSLILPRSSLGYQTNNKYPKFPPKMTDGRCIVSSWQNETKINDELIKKNHITSNWEYRKFLTKHATTIMEYNLKESANDTGYILPSLEEQKQKQKQKHQIHPSTFDSLNDRSKPFQNSDLKEIYLTREQLNAKKISPFILK